MTPNPRTVAPNDTIQNAARIMRDEDTGVVPVVENGRPVGMVTDRDIVIRAVADGNRSDHLVRDIVTGTVVAATPDMSTREASQLMAEHQIRRLPVVENDRPVGILTSRDIRFEMNLAQPVSKLMTKKLVTVPPGVSGERARELLHEHRIEKLLVVGEDGTLVGLITIKDLLQAERFPFAIKDEMVDKVVQVIVQAANTGRIGDGKIFVMPIEEVIRIRTGERGPDAV